MKDADLTKSSRLQSGLQFSVGRVIPPHISGVNEFPTSRALSINDAKTIFRCRSERFLAQDGLSGTDRRENKVAVRMIRRGNDDSLNFWTVDQLERISANPRVGCGFPGSGRIRIRHGDQMCAGYMAADKSGVIRPHHASTNDSNSYAQITSSHIQLAG
jgi:hypothetical protein